MDISTVTELIDNLNAQSLELSSHQEIKQALTALGKFGIIESTLHSNYELIRACPNSNLYESISTLDRISFKPQELNDSYQRASTPFQTMFYGCSQQFDNPNKIESIGRITALIESMPVLRDKESKGIWKLTFGRWIVLSDIRLVAICYKKALVEKVPQMELMYESYQEFLKKTPEIQERSIVVSGFLAHEFSKEVNLKESYNYKISSIYTELIREMGFDGVSYPSVSTAGDGINIAITPNAVNRSLQCQVVGECFVLKNREKIKVLNGDQVFLKPEQKEFELAKFNKTIFDKTDFSEVIAELYLWDVVHQIV